MQRAFLLIALACLLPSLAQARGKIDGWCEDGGQTVTVPGATAVSTTRVQRSYPSCTVTVYLPGTTTIVTLYSTASGTAQGNPFTAAATGRWSFYTDEPLVDIRFSGGGILTPFTRGDVGVPASIVDSLMSFGAFCDGTTNDATALSAASTALGVSGGTVVMPNGKTCVIAGNVSTDADVEIDFNGGGKFSVSNGFTLTLNGSFTAGRHQVFTGAGTVSFGAQLLYADPIWWGAVYDNATDDASAIQKAINSVGNTTPTIRSGGDVYIGGCAAIGSTLVINKKSTTIRGNGIGSISAASPPNTSCLRWIGAANVPMIHIKDALAGVVIRDFRIFGNTTNIPRSAISITRTAASGIGPTNHTIEGVWFGGVAGDTGYDSGTSFQDVIYIGDTYDSGIQTHNDSMTVRNFRINSCTGAGIRTGGIQNVLTDVLHGYVTGCAYGVRAVAGMNLKTVFFSGNTIADIYVPLNDDAGVAVSAVLTGVDVSSENGKRFMQLDGNAVVDITGGYWQLTTNLNADTKVIIADNNLPQAVRLKSYRITNSGYGASTPWIISLRSAVAGNVSKALVLDGFLVNSAADPTFNMDTRNTIDQRYVCVRYDQGFWGSAAADAFRSTCNVMIGNGDTVDTTRYDIPANTLRFGTRALGEGAGELKTKTLPLTLSGATSDLTNFIPTNSLVLGVVATITTAVNCGGCTWTLGSPASAAKWSSTSSTGLGTDINLANWSLAGVGTGPYYIQAAETVRATANASTFSAGVLTVTAFYVQFVNYPDF